MSRPLPVSPQLQDVFDHVERHKVKPPRDCNRCGGGGQLPSGPCPACAGDGKIRAARVKSWDPELDARGRKR